MVYLKTSCDMSFKPYKLFCGCGFTHLGQKSQGNGNHVIQVNTTTSQMQLLQIHRTWDQVTLHLRTLSNIFVLSRNIAILVGSDSRNAAASLPWVGNVSMPFAMSATWPWPSNSDSTACMAIVDNWLWLCYFGSILAEEKISPWTNKRLISQVCHAKPKIASFSGMYSGFEDKQSRD